MEFDDHLVRILFDATYFQPCCLQDCAALQSKMPLTSLQRTSQPKYCFQTAVMYDKISKLGKEDDKALFQLFSSAKVGQKQQSRTSVFCKLRIFTTD